MYHLVTDFFFLRTSGNDPRQTTRSQTKNSNSVRFSRSGLSKNHKMAAFSHFSFLFYCFLKQYISLVGKLFDFLWVNIRKICNKPFCLKSVPDWHVVALSNYGDWKYKEKQKNYYFLLFFIYKKGKHNKIFNCYNVIQIWIPFKMRPVPIR